MKETKSWVHLLVPLGLVLAIVVLALNTKAPDVNVSTQEGGMQDTISVSGTGKVTVSPDEAEVYIRIVTEAEDANSAQDENAEISEDVRNSLKNRGVSNDEMETSSYYLQPKTSYDMETGESYIYGYTVMHTLKVTTGDIVNTGSLVDAAVNAGANSLDRVNFQLSDELRDGAYRQALERASGNAKTKAESIAKALTVNLGGISRVSESGVSYTPYRYYDMAEAESPKAAGAPTVISPQDIEVSASVSIVYEIE